jgi:hypothetical protein
VLQMLWRCRLREAQRRLQRMCSHLLLWPAAVRQR